MPDENCKICGGTGWRIVERGGLSGAARCECSVAVQQTTAKDNARIPPNYHRASLDNFAIPHDNPIAREKLAQVQISVKRFVSDYVPGAERPGLLLIGNPGTGKTHLAVGALRALIDHGFEGIFFDYLSLLDRIRQSYDAASGVTDRNPYRAALEAPILLLDDLGSEQVTEWALDTVTSIITDRCNNRKTLIATTNLPDENITGNIVEYVTPSGKEVYRKSLTEMIGSRARSRLFEMCRIVRMPSVEDYRVKRAR